jgi:hypothetical protein
MSTLTHRSSASSRQLADGKGRRKPDAYLLLSFFRKRSCKTNPRLGAFRHEEPCSLHIVFFDYYLDDSVITISMTLRRIA